MFSIFKKRRQDDAFRLSRTERNAFFKDLIESSALKKEFYFLLIISTFIVIAGLLKNSVILLIGGMLVAPLLSPILALSLAIAITNLKVAWRSLKIFLITSLISMAVAAIVGLLMPFHTNELSLLRQMAPGWMEIFIAALAGAAASLTWAKKKLNNNLAGIAITVTLLPPLVAAGLSLGALDYFLFIAALETYLFNVLGIIIGSLAVFSNMKFRHSEKQVVAEVEQEDKKT